MTFQEGINKYIDILDCSVKDLAEAAELSVATISRYKNGERRPSADSIQLEKLVRGIIKIAVEKGSTALSERSVLYDLKKSLTDIYDQYDIFSKNFNTLSEAFKINMKDLATATNFDTSYLYRIRSGQRRPNDLETFANLICNYIVIHFSDTYHKEILANYIKCELSDMDEDDSYFSCIKEAFFLSNPEDEDKKMETFLEKLDEFDLDEYIRAIHFDELKLPTVPFKLPTSKNYFGIEQMKQGELDFFKATVLAKSSEPIFMCSDMPMADMAEDMEFNKKWMFAIAMSLKKGLHLNIIHNINRPFDEMMLGLEAWIPIYMTGQVSPYHLRDVSTDVYHHFNYVSGTVALTGECIEGSHDDGKYYLTNNKEEVAYYRKKSDLLLKKATPLMDIYRSADKNRYDAFMDSTKKESDVRYHILSTLPLYTLSRDLLTQIISEASLTSDEVKAIYKYYNDQLTQTMQQLEHSCITDEIPELTREEFMKKPLTLSLSGMFFEKEIPYTYETYLQHLEQTKQFTKDNFNYLVKINKAPAFRNIQIQILGDKWVMISKNKAPAIHFVIHHPKMVNALKHFVAPVYL